MSKVIFCSAIILAMSFAPVQAQDAPVENLSYEVFIEKVKAGQIKSVTLEAFFVGGTYQQGQDEREFFAQRPLDAAADPLLTAVLAEHNVAVVKKEQPEASSADWVSRNAPFLLLMFVPSVLLVFVLIYVIRVNNKIDQVLIR